MRRWEEAFEVWLEERRTQFNPKVGRDSYQAWREFLAFTQKAPWEVQVEDVEAYIEALKDRGLRTGTIYKRLAGLSKFYEHCQREGVDPECGAEFNPVSRARRPKLSKYEEAKTLSREAETALLEAIRQDPSPTGKRDYALFLTLLTTGRRAGEIRRLKWGALESEGERTWMRMGQGEKIQCVVLPRAVWEAIRDSLEAAGRLARIEAEEYVFAPGREPLVREAGGRAEDWDGKQPLSMDQVHYLLKLYAGWAGIREEEITCHVLRHTAAMRMKEGGETVEMIRTRLGRESVSETRGYLKRLANQAKVRVEQGKMANGEEGWVPDRGPGRAQPRNHLALKHGLTAKYLPEMEWLEEHGHRLEGLDAEIMRYRIVMLRALILSKETVTVEEMRFLLNAAGVAAVRSAKLKQLKWKLREA